jgi:hypothetical protein
VCGVEYQREREGGGEKVLEGEYGANAVYTHMQCKNDTC